jgi:hypothetical protein
MAEQLKSVRGNLKRIIPEHIISENNYNFLEMLDAYYKWCESHGQWLNETKQLIDNYNYELIANDKLFVYKDVFLRLFPIDNPDMIRSLVKFSKVFYEHRGNLESYKFLFKLLWNEDIEIEYPTDWILRSSDGIWTANQYLLVSYNDNFENLIGNKIVGEISKSSGVIDSVSTVITESKIYTKLRLQKLTGNFILDENVTVFIESTNKKYTAVVYPLLGAYEIVNKGKGYIEGADIPVLYDGSGKYFKATISAVDESGGILSLNIKPGINYIYDKPELILDDINLKSLTLPFEKAVINLNNVALFQENGYYKELKSALSDKWKLRDGHYYQEFSYVINTSMKLNKIIKPIKDLLHPAGTKLWINSSYNFGDISSENKILFYNTRKILDNKNINYDLNNVINLTEEKIINNSDIDDNGIPKNPELENIYAFDDTSEKNFDKRIYFSYEKLLTSIVTE